MFSIVKLGFTRGFLFFLIFALKHRLWVLVRTASVGSRQGFWGSGEKGFLFSGSWGALLIILGELGSKHILWGI